jgi:uncharacterized protein YqgC (DUF456 family)
VEVVGMIFFWIFLIVGIVLIPFNLPGTFVIVADALVFGLITKFDRITIPFVLTLLVIAVCLEAMEAFLGAAMAKKYGGSKWAMGGAVLGGIVGAIFGTPITPVLGTLIGLLIGAFLGASLLEGLHSGNWENAWRVGLGAFFGTLGGKVTKILVAVVMVIMIGFKVF